VPGPRAKLRAVEDREGRPGHRQVREGIRLPPRAPAEPDWREFFPVLKGARGQATTRSRRIARGCWQFHCKLLEPLGVLSEAFLLGLQDICVLAARIDECERLLSTQGLTILNRTDRGTTRNQAAMLLKQFRDSYWSGLREFGLTPTSWDKLNPRPSPEGESDFD